MYRRKAHARVCPQGKFLLPREARDLKFALEEDERVEACLPRARPKTCKGRQEVMHTGKFLFVQKHQPGFVRPGTAPLKRGGPRRSNKGATPIDIYLRKLGCSGGKDLASNQTHRRLASSCAKVYLVYLLRDGENPVGVEGFEGEKLVQCVSKNDFYYFVTESGSIFGVPCALGANRLEARLLQPSLRGRVERISCGEHHTVAIVRGNNKLRAFGWGSNRFGELGATSSGEVTEGMYIEEFDDKQPWTAACGLHATLVLNAIGQVWGIGNSKAGILGHGTYEVCQKPVRMILDQRATSVVCGQTHSVVLLEDSMIVESGAYSGQATRICAPQQVRISAVLKSSQVITLGAHACSSFALFKSGKLYVWGPAFKGYERSKDQAGCVLGYFERNKIFCRSASMSDNSLVVTSQTGNLYVANLKSNQEGNVSFRVVEYFAKGSIRINQTSCSKTTICAARCTPPRNNILCLPKSSGPDLGCFDVVATGPLAIQSGRCTRMTIVKANCLVKVKARFQQANTPLAIELYNTPSLRSELQIVCKDASFEGKVVLLLEGKVPLSPFQPLRRCLTLHVQPLISHSSWTATGEGLVKYGKALNSFRVDLSSEGFQMSDFLCRPEIVLSDGSSYESKIDARGLTCSYSSESRDALTVEITFRDRHIPGSPFCVEPKPVFVCPRKSRILLDKGNRAVLRLKSSTNEPLSGISSDILLIKCFGGKDEELHGVQYICESAEKGSYVLTRIPEAAKKVSVETTCGIELTGSPLDLREKIQVSLCDKSVIEGDPVKFRCRPAATAKITAMVNGHRRSQRVQNCAAFTIPLPKLAHPGQRRPDYVTINLSSEDAILQQQVARIRVIPRVVWLVQSHKEVTRSEVVSDGFYYESELCAVVLDTERSQQLRSYVDFAKKVSCAVVSDDFLRLKMINTVAYEGVRECFPFMEPVILGPILCKYFCDKCEVPCQLLPTSGNGYVVSL